jgi:hypothetical protein
METAKIFNSKGVQITSGKVSKNLPIPLGKIFIFPLKNE